MLDLLDDEAAAGSRGVLSVHSAATAIHSCSARHEAFDRRRRSPQADDPVKRTESVLEIRHGATSSRVAISEEFLDLAMSEIDERKRPPGRAWELGFEVEAQAVEDGRGDVGRLDGAVGRARRRSGRWPRPPGLLERRRRRTRR